MGTNRRIAACVLAAVLILLVAIPSFALSGGKGEELPDNATAEKLEQAEQQESTDQQENTDQPEQTELPQEISGSVEQDQQLQETSGQEEPEEIPAEESTKDEEEAASPAPAKATKAVLKAASGLPENNSKVSYNSVGSHPVKFVVKAGNYTFKGTCATLGVDNADSGKAIVKRISNNSRIAKLVYYYGYKKGWWQGKNSTKKATAVMGFTDKNCTENAKQCIEALIQRDNMGWDAFWAARKVGKYRMYSTDTFMHEISSLYKNTDVSKITIPDDVVFEMFHGVTSSSKVQDFYVWRYKEIPTTPNGFVAVEKVSGNVSITD